MIRLRSVSTPFLMMLAAACASGRTTSAPAPAPAPTVDAAPVPAVTATVAPRDWHLLDETADHFAGISANRAYAELLVGKQPRRTVVVAVIDGGTDTAQVDLRTNLWVNPKEIAGNGRDDDNNGYVDDVHGWNFIGGRDGRDVGKDTYEVTRIYARCTASVPPTPPLSDYERTQCARATREVEAKRDEDQQDLHDVQVTADTLAFATRVLAQALGPDSLSPSRVMAFTATSAELQLAKQIYLTLATRGVTPELIADYKKEISGELDFAYNPSFNPRPIVGDNYADLNERHYGNSDVSGPDALHGTHVAGIIGAERGNGIGIDGIAPAVKLMIVRAVPDGDERDKDIANAIRYAVDNGANVISMSFGKAYSPQKAAVDDAVKYADAHGVLMVHAAGNDASDVSLSANFPNPFYLAGGRAQSWIEVGASGWQGGADLPADFSNYGRAQVDVFAPGVDVTSTVPGNQYRPLSGTSMAAPVVSGLAALVMAYYPELSAAQVKQVILASATRHTQQMVQLPGAPTRVPFGNLSATGGIVNAAAALRMAATQAARKH